MRWRAPFNKFVCLFSVLALIDGIVLSQGGFGPLNHCFSSWQFFFSLSPKGRAGGNKFRWGECKARN